MANWWWLVLLALVLLVAVIVLVRRRRARQPRTAASFGVEAAPLAVSVQLRVMRVLAGWAGFAVADVPPASKKIADLWRQKPGNPLLTDGHLSDLIARLKSELPKAQLGLSPGDLRDGGGLAYRMAGSQRDVTVQKGRDALTGLPNRLLFADRVERAIARAKQGKNGQFAVFGLELEQLKAALTRAVMEKELLQQALDIERKQRPTRPSRWRR